VFVGNAPGRSSLARHSPFLSGVGLQGAGTGGAASDAHPVPLAQAFSPALACPQRQAGVSPPGESLTFMGVALTPETENALA